MLSIRCTPGRPSKASSELGRVFIQAAQRGDCTARKLVEKHKSLTGFCRVKQMLQDVAHLEWTRMRTAPKLAKCHKE
eukprot:IDg9416t1